MPDGQDDLRKWYPEIADRLRITLIEALPNVLPAFSKQLIQYTESTFKENKIDVLTRTMVKDVGERSVTVQDASKEMREIPYGLLVWATGNTSRTITRNLMAKLPAAQTQRRGIVVDDYLNMLGAEGIYAIGDCTATQYAPTAQVASQQGMYLATMFGKLGQKHKYEQQLAALRAQQGVPQEEVDAVVKKINRAAKVSPFSYSHQVRLPSRLASPPGPRRENEGADTDGPGLARVHWLLKGHCRPAALQRQPRFRRRRRHAVLAFRLPGSSHPTHLFRGPVC